MTDKKWIKILLITTSYLLVAALAVTATWWLTKPEEPSKLDKLQALLTEKYIGQADQTAMEDAAASAMVEAMGDRWSYYISAESYAAHQERKKNAYVGIGITITVREDNVGFDVTRVEPGGPAQEAGVQPGDILTHAEGQPVAELGTDGAAAVIKGKEGTMVNVTFLRGDQVLELTMERRTIHQAVAESQMLPGNMGYIKINNFNSNNFTSLICNFISKNAFSTACLNPILFNFSTFSKTVFCYCKKCCITTSKNRFHTNNFIIII